MAINNYITFDGKRYATTADQWEPQFRKPVTIRITLEGELDVTWASAGLYAWDGEIRADVTPRAAEWGSPTNLEASLAKLQKVTMVDHYGTSYTVAVDSWQMSSIIPEWENADNTIKYKVTVKGVPT